MALNPMAWPSLLVGFPTNGHNQREQLAISQPGAILKSEVARNFYITLDGFKCDRKVFRLDKDGLFAWMDPFRCWCRVGSQQTVQYKV